MRDKAAIGRPGNTGEGWGKEGTIFAGFRAAQRRNGNGAKCGTV